MESLDTKVLVHLTKCAENHLLLKDQQSFIHLRCHTSVLRLDFLTHVHQKQIGFLHGIFEVLLGEPLEVRARQNSLGASICHSQHRMPHMQQRIRQGRFWVLAQDLIDLFANVACLPQCHRSE